MTPDEAARSCDDGSVDQKTSEKLREMLKAVSHARATNPNYAHRMTQCAELIRQLLLSRDQAAALAEAREQHRSSYELGEKTLLWTIIAAAAAVVAALAALWSLFVTFARH
jgi:hypothetical protein